jgi:hypothetical protein
VSFIFLLRAHISLFDVVWQFKIGLRHVKNKNMERVLWIIGWEVSNLHALVNVEENLFEPSYPQHRWSRKS